MISKVGIKGGYQYDGILGIVASEFSERKKLVSVISVKITIDSQVLFQ